MTEREVISTATTLDHAENQMGISPKLVVLRGFMGSETGQITSSKGFLFIVSRDAPDAYINVSPHVSKYQVVKVPVNGPERVDSNGKGSGWVTGSWTDYIFAVPDGTLVKLFSQSQYTGLGSALAGVAAKRTSGAYFQAKKDAAEVLIIGAGRYRKTFPWLQGRGVILTPDEVCKMGIEIEMRYTHVYDTELNGVIIHQVAQARSAVTKQIIKGRKLSL